MIEHMYYKWKIKRKLIELYISTYKKWENNLQRTEFNSYGEIKSHRALCHKQVLLCNAVAYILCNFLNFNYKFYIKYGFFLNIYKFRIADDFINRREDCYQAYNKLNDDFKKMIELLLDKQNAV